MATTRHARPSRLQIILGFSGVLLLALAVALIWPRPAEQIPADTEHVAVSTDGTKQAPTPQQTYAGTTCPTTTPAPEATKNQPGTWSLPALNLTAPWATDTHGTSPVLPDAPAGIRYAPSMPIGSTHGASILAGHVDYAPGALSEAGGELSPWGHLHQAKPCQQIIVTDEAGTAHHYLVTGLQTADQDQLPDDELFRADGAPTLYLITCSGPSIGDAGGRFQFHYAENLIVTAHLID